MMSSQDPAELLQDVTEEAASLLGSSGAAIQLLDPASGDVRWAHDAGIDPASAPELARHDAVVDGVPARRSGAGASSLTDDYAADERFPDGAGTPTSCATGIRSVAFAPLVGEATVLGTLAVFAREPAGSVRSRATCSPRSRTSRRSRSTTRT